MPLTLLGTGAGPGFVKRGFRCVKEGVGVVLLILSNFYKLSHENEIIETKLFHFHGIFKKNLGRGSSEPLNPLWICHWDMLASISAFMR